MALDGIRDQPEAVTLLRRALVTGRVAHAYAFVGPEGSGRRATLLEVAEGRGRVLFSQLNLGAALAHERPLDRLRLRVHSSQLQPGARFSEGCLHLSGDSREALVGADRKRDMRRVIPRHVDHWRDRVTHALVLGVGDNADHVKCGTVAVQTQLECPVYWLLAAKQLSRDCLVDHDRLGLDVLFAWEKVTSSKQSGPHGFEKARRDSEHDCFDRG